MAVSARDHRRIRLAEDADVSESEEIGREVGGGFILAA
jgi:hypothetical protein